MRRRSGALDAESSEEYLYKYTKNLLNHEEDLKRKSNSLGNSPIGSPSFNALLKPRTDEQGLK